MNSFVSKNLSKILQNKDDTEKLYSDILDDTSDKRQFDFTSHANKKFVITLQEDIEIAKNKDDNK